MPRSVNHVASKARRKKILKLTRGYFGARKNVWTVAKNTWEKGLTYAFRDRRNKKRNFRALWIQRINAAARLEGMSYSKFLYQLKKRQKEQKAKQVKVNVKEIRFGPQTDDHDYNFKLKHAKGFLEDGDKVKAYVFFKGRSILFKEQGEVLLLRFANDLEDYAKVDQMPILEGKRMTIQLSPKKKEASKKPATAGAPKPAAPAQKAEKPETGEE